MPHGRWMVEMSVGRNGRTNGRQRRLFILQTLQIGLPDASGDRDASPKAMF